MHIGETLYSSSSSMMVLKDGELKLLDPVDAVGGEKKAMAELLLANRSQSQKMAELESKLDTILDMLEGKALLS